MDGLVRFTVTIHVQGDDLNMFRVHWEQVMKGTIGGWFGQVHSNNTCAG